MLTTKALPIVATISAMALSGCGNGSDPIFLVAAPVVAVQAARKEITFFCNRNDNRRLPPAVLINLPQAWTGPFVSDELLRFQFEGQPNGQSVGVLYNVKLELSSQTDGSSQASLDLDDNVRKAAENSSKISILLSYPPNDAFHRGIKMVRRDAAPLRMIIATCRLSG